MYIFVTTTCKYPLYFPNRTDLNQNQNDKNKFEIDNQKLKNDIDKLKIENDQHTANFKEIFNSDQEVKKKLKNENLELKCRNLALEDDLKKAKVEVEKGVLLLLSIDLVCARLSVMLGPFESWLKW